MDNQAAVMYGTYDVRLEDRLVPEPGSKDILVRIRAVGVCGSDVHFYEYGKIGKTIVQEPLILGHEPSGDVVKLGNEVTKHSVGERVTLEPGVPCGRCRECRSGRYNLCQDVQFFASPPIDGAFTKYVTIHEDFAYKLPDSVSYDVGALMEPLSVGIWACRIANVTAGDRVLITGAGPIGLLTMQVIIAFGAIDVTVTDVSTERLELAKKTGATRVMNPAEGSLPNMLPSEVDVFIECSANEQALQDGIRCLRPAGVAVVVGMSVEEEATIPLSFIQSKEIWLTGTFRYANTYPTAIELTASGKIDLEPIITGHYGLEEAEKALQSGRVDPGNVKSMIVPEL